MIDHVSIPVSRLEESAAFYEKVLEPVGLTRLVDRARTVGFGKKYPELWLNARPDMTPGTDDTGNHVCLRAADNEAVKAFHAAALEQGGRNAGDPGLRKASMSIYFGAFIFDLDGNKVEAVTFPR